jgi:hypothetical protein
MAATGATRQLALVLDDETAAAAYLEGFHGRKL